MLVLNANQEQKHVFNDLIQEMDAQVVWNGRFIIMGDRLILEGFVRSLFLHFDIQQAEVKLADLPMEDDGELDMEGCPGLGDLITMAVYIFGKWGIIKGIQLEQDIEQLEQTFGGILGKYQLDLAFSVDHAEFYRSGVRITYEDVLEAAIANPQAAVPELKMPAVIRKPENIQNAGGQGKNTQHPQRSDRTAQAAGAKNSTAAEGRDNDAAAQRIEKYHARISVLDRLSNIQKKALLRDIRFDNMLNEQEKEELYDPIQDYEYQERMRKIETELADKANANYLHIQKMIPRIEKEELFEKTKQAVLERLEELQMEYGMQEVCAIMEKVPAHVERAEYKELMEKLAPYEGIDLGAYKEPLRKMRETLEIKEISNLLMQSPKKSRGDYTELLRRMEEKDFARENAAPYVERILDWISEFDKQRLNKLLSNAGTMDFETAASLYELIRQESFLPELRAGALAVVSGRLEEICVSECKIYVNALQKSMAGVIKESPRHQFYPAEKILLKTARPEDIKRIDSAVSSYAQKKGRFEYPILMVDTSKEGNGRDGMLLTPEHLFYSTRLSGYRIAVSAVRSVYVSVGLLNHKSLIVEEADGIRHKVPYAVEAEELQKWAEVLEQFIRQLKERPAVDNLSYESLKEQGTVSCTRCGCVYQHKNACPECGLRVLKMA